MTNAFSWQNSISLCPASFRIPRPNSPVTPGVSWLPTFAFQSPIMKRISFLSVSSKRSCIQAFVGKVISLLFNMLSRLVVAFLPRIKCLLISWLQSPSEVILEPKRLKSVTVSSSICHEVMGPDAMILVFLMLSFKPALSLYSFTFIKRLFSSSSFSAIRVVSSAYLRLLIFLPAILIPASAYPTQCFSWWTLHIS